MPDPVRSRPASSRTVAAVLALFAAAGLARAQSEAPPADALTTLRYEWLRQLAEQDAANLEVERISTIPAGGLTVGNFQDPSVILKELGPVLNKDYEHAQNKLADLAAKARTRREEVQKDWAEVYKQRAAFRQYAEKQQKTFGFDFETGKQTGFKPDVIDAALVGWAAVVVLVALRLRRRERRLVLRRAERVAAAGSLLLALAGLSGCGGPSAGAPGAWAKREEAELAAARDEAAKKAADANAAANEKWDIAARRWADLVTASGSDVGETVRVGEATIRKRLREVTAEAALADRLVKDAEEQRAKLDEERAKLDGLVDGAKWRAGAVVGVRVGIAGLLFVLSIAPFWTARRTRRAAIKLASRTCPRCFRLDTLRPESGAGGGASRYAPSRRRGARAKAVVEDVEESGDEDADGEDKSGEDDREMKCSKCGLTIKYSLLKVPRLCFPTVGIRSSGKTHMLVTAYDRVKKRTAPSVATVQPAAATKNREAEKRFDRLIDLILNRRSEAGGTDLTLPDPILLHLKDNDRAGENSALVNLFDYSGELINPDVDINQLKGTAVRMDGFMLFLDPTQLYGEGAHATLDQQLGYLDDFLGHMRRERKVPLGEPIPVPVAVCIPKFDLLIEDNPIGPQSVEYIRQLLGELNPPPRHMTLDVLRERSDVVEQMLPMMFSGADVRGIIEGYFGRQLMFFPMSSVSLFEHELGIKDLSRRTMAPFGVTEPILWLLHMHGYSVFAGD